MPTSDQELVMSIASAWGRLERRLDTALSNIKGVSFREYRLMKAIAEAPGGTMSRVDLASAIGVTPSGATRALRPLEKLGFVATVQSDRDARLSLASLTDEGQELVTDAAGVVDDSLATAFSRAPAASAGRETLREVLEELTVV